MGRVAERLADQVVLTDDNPRGEDGLAIVREIQAGMERPERSIVIRDRAGAIAHALGRAELGDIVLVAGKGHETDQVVGEERLPCDDHDSVRRALGVAA
jgi:UDP-N-acetylmuramoyl-L-alanyl-D-glutamate--2,6-diaminopimelate ligase